MAIKIAPVLSGGQTHDVTVGETIYRGVARAAPVVLGGLAPLSSRLQRAVAGRRDAEASLQEWAAAHRDPARPLLWLHAPSVGEALMAQAILAAARHRRPDLQAAFTFFSPSAERVAARVGADWAGYLPWDTPAACRAALDALRPAAVAFVRTEIWPVLLAEARDRGIRAVLLNAVLAATSSRVGRGARFLLGNAYRSLDAVGAVTAADGARFGVLGVFPDRVHLTGDARFDQVWQRVGNLQPSPLVRSLAAASGTLLVAGSTWPADEALLMEVLPRLNTAGRRVRLVVAPHEPTPVHLRALEERAESAGLSHGRLPAMDAARIPDAHVLVVDRVGVLADLYAAADLAYVGGGFGTAGLHSVVEPAALGVPVLFGPRHGNAGEAGRLEAAGGGHAVASADELQFRLEQWVADAGRSEEAAAAAASARRFVEGELGGAARNAALALP
jgi:3-deoxy-D-manno-octulosonic-acid transferase